VHQELEKDINLQIAKLLQKELEDVGIRVVMTRETDADLSDADASNKKRQSLQRRCELAARENPDCVVSIHQNSYTDDKADSTSCPILLNEIKNTRYNEEYSRNSHSPIDSLRTEYDKQNTDDYVKNSGKKLRIFLVLHGFISFL